MEADNALLTKVAEAAKGVTWFGYYDDDEDVQHAVEALRDAIAAWKAQHGQGE